MWKKDRERIKQLELEVKTLNKELWGIKNPPFKVGEEVYTLKRYSEDEWLGKLIITYVELKDWTWFCGSISYYWDYIVYDPKNKKSYTRDSLDYTITKNKPK